MLSLKLIVKFTILAGFTINFISGKELFAKSLNPLPKLEHLLVDHQSKITKDINSKPKKNDTELFIQRIILEERLKKRSVSIEFIEQPLKNKVPVQLKSKVMDQADFDQLFND